MPFLIIEFKATADTLRQRVAARRTEDKKDPSEADIGVLNYQLQNYLPLTDEEKMYSLTINTENEMLVEKVIAEINNKI